MLEFAEIESAIRAKHQHLVASHPGFADAVRVYRHGIPEDNAWFVAGMYAYAAPDQRLVFEALFLERFDGCVFRVFQETPLTVFYARKAIGHFSKCAVIINEAAEQFQMHLPKQMLSKFEHDASEGWGPEIEYVLLPVPPPVNFGEIPE